MQVAVAEQATVSMAKIAESAKEGLMALAVGTGLQVVAAMFAKDTERPCEACGPIVAAAAPGWSPPGRR